MNDAFYQLGYDFEMLGRAMQDPKTDIDTLASLAHKCGLRLEFRITPDVVEEPAESGQ